jgi:4-oxalocrotonate tautomerase
VPIVNILITREGASPGHSAATAEEKARLIKGISNLLLEVLGKPLDSTFVTIHEVELENWGIGGLPTPEFRKRRAALAVPPHSEPPQTRSKPGVSR